MRLLLALLASLLLNNLPAPAQSTPDMTGIAYERRQGARLPSKSAFTDADGRDVGVGELFNRAPLVLVLGYFSCEKLCAVARPALLRAARKAGLTAGADYVFVAVSIDPAETADAARKARDIDFAAAAPMGTADGFHYLTGAPDDIRALAESVGYRYRESARPDAFSHPIGAVVATPSGIVSGYLSAIGTSPEEMSEAIRTAAAESVNLARASPAFLLCFDFDSTTGRYTFAIVKFLRLAAVVMMLALAAFIFREIRKGARA
ncbi:MAG: SCO family protein [Methylocystis sp.]